MGIELNVGSGGSTLASHTESGEEVTLSKLMYGGEGSGVLVAAATPLPITPRTPNGDSVCDDTNDCVKTSVVVALPTGSNTIGVVDLGATDNAVLDAIAASVATTAAADLMLGTDFSAVFGSSSLITATQADDIANTVDTLNASAFGYVFDGTAWDRMRGDATNGVLVNLGANNDVTIGAALPTGSNTIGDVTISGDALTALQLLDDVIKTDDAAFTPASDKVAMVGAQFDDAATDTVDEGDAGALRMSTRRELYTQIRDAAGNERGVNVDSSNRMAVVASQTGTWNVATVTTVTTVSTLTTITNAVKSVGNTAHDAALSDAPVCIGGFAKAAAPTSVSADGDAVRAWFALNGAQFVVLVGADGQQSGVLSHGAQKVGGDWEHLDDSAFTPAGARVAMVGFFADETSTDSVNEGDGGAARMTLDRKQIVTDYAHTTGGESSLSALSTAAVYTAEVKGSAGQIYSVDIFNKGAAAVYARLYDQTGAPGTGDAANIIWRGIVPGNTAGAGFIRTWPKGKSCATGIGIRVSGAIADNDATALAANEVTINVGYK